MKFAFISRHEPTPDQLAIAAADGIKLVHIGDADAFLVTRAFVDEHGAFDCAHSLPLACSKTPIGRALVRRLSLLHVFDMKGTTP